MNRRGFITGLVSLVAAPAIVRADSLMKIRPWFEDGVYFDIVSYPVVYPDDWEPPCLADFQKILLPGIRSITLDYAKYTEQYAEIFCA